MLSFNRRTFLITGSSSLSALALPTLVMPSSKEANEALQTVKLLTEIDEGTYGMLWENLRGVSEAELDWQPLKEANSVRWIIGHLCWFEEWVPDAIEGKGRYLTDKGPSIVEERPYEKLKERFEAARKRFLQVTGALKPEDLQREISFFGRFNVAIGGLLQTHTTHLAGHRYQVRYVRGTYSRVHGTKKADFDPW